MAWKGAAVFGLLFVSNSILSDEPSSCLVPISLMAIYTGCAISTLHTSYYSKYIVACALMAVSALGVTQRNSVSDAYVNYKSKVKVDLKTAELIAARAKSYESILCDKYFKRILTNREFGYINDTTMLSCPDDKSYYQWLIYSNFTTDPHVILLREDESFEKKHTIYIGECVDEIYYFNWKK